MHIRIRLFCVLPAFALAAACGGSDDSDPGGEQTVNDCAASAAEDHTADTDTHVAFGGTLGNVFSPACVRVHAGANVIFDGTFASHPLRGGTATDQEERVDASSPIPSTDTGTTLTVPFPSAGTFPFYCVPHGTVGMRGAVFVE